MLMAWHWLRFKRCIYLGLRTFPISLIIGQAVVRARTERERERVDVKTQINPEITNNPNVFPFASNLWNSISIYYIYLYRKVDYKPLSQTHCQRCCHDGSRFIVPILGLEAACVYHTECGCDVESDCIE